ncbi:hypothetical protein BJ170DRAFT_431051 [Xylariales sp. AK1849]|nr:hypothetical protein BJ170DRAFT_431051 [Xylariales sp. AK1849]
MVQGLAIQHSNGIRNPTDKARVPSNNRWMPGTSGASQTVAEDSDPQRPFKVPSAGHDFTPSASRDMNVPTESKIDTTTSLVSHAGSLLTRPFPHVPNEDLIDKIFECDRDRLDAIKMHKDSKGGVPQIFRFGIQYCPNIPTALIRPKQQHRDYECRNVLFTGLRDDTKSRDVLARVRGGKIIQIVLVNATGIGDGMTALVSFANWHNAHSYVAYARSGNVITVRDSRVTVSLSGQPSYPLSEDTQKRLRMGQSRCLEINEFPKQMGCQLLRQIDYFFRDARYALEDFWIDTQGVAFILFNKIEYAIRVHQFISGDQQYKDIWSNLVFGDDPCCRPLQSLHLHRGGGGLARGGHDSLLDDCVEQKQDDGYHIETTIMLDTQAFRAANPQATQLAQSPVQVEQVTVKDVRYFSKRSDGDKFMPDNEEWRGHKVYSMDEYLLRYGYDEYKSDRVKWETNWPYVGSLKKFEVFKDPASQVTSLT